jgi:2-hydroxy-3-oxopropionate reductase
MGGPQARRLLAGGTQLTVWNRTPDKAEALGPAGATVSTEAADAVRNADVVILMLENGPVVERVLFGSGVARSLRPGAIVVDMSSIKPAEAQDHAGRLANSASPIWTRRSRVALSAPRPARLPSWWGASLTSSPGSSRCFG